MLYAAQDNQTGPAMILRTLGMEIPLLHRNYETGHEIRDVAV